MPQMFYLLFILSGSISYSSLAQTTFPNVFFRTTLTNNGIDDIKTISGQRHINVCSFDINNEAPHQQHESQHWIRTISLLLHSASVSSFLRLTVEKIATNNVQLQSNLNIVISSQLLLKYLKLTQASYSSYSFTIDNYRIKDVVKWERMRYTFLLY